MRLLVVEDEPRMAQILQAALEAADFTVDVVGTGGDAREALSMVPYDAAVLDLGLPDGDGMLLLRALRRDGNRVPILILTARDTVEDRVGGLDAGADDYLVKPFALAEVIARIKALLRREHLAPRSPPAMSCLTQSAAMSVSTTGRSRCRGAKAPFSSI